MTRDTELPEHALARNQDGVCVVCEAGHGEAHDFSAHDSWEAAEDATYD